MKPLFNKYIVCVGVCVCVDKHAHVCQAVTLPVYNTAVRLADQCDSK